MSKSKKRRSPAPRALPSQPAPRSSATEADAALDALADALAPRLFERLKKLAAEEIERNADDKDVLDFLYGIGWRPES